MSRGVLSENIRDLYPGYFALIMATGIVSISCHLFNLNVISISLLYLNLIAYLTVWALTIMRILRFWTHFRDDLISHAKGPAFFTVIAGTTILGSQFFLLKQMSWLSMALWLWAILLWFVLVYTFLTAVTMREEKPPLENSLSGAWLILVVATQSISVLGSTIAAEFATQELIFFFSLCMYLLGCMLYIPIISLIFYRWTFFRMTAIQLTPPYWINMGALAITTLAGSRLILNSGNQPLLQDLSPFLKGFTLFFWSTGSWWIPLLLLLGAWRHLYKRVPLSYDPQYWGMVFPLGMYTTATFVLADAIEIPWLKYLAQGFLYIALLAWLITFVGFMRQMRRELVSQREA